MAIAARQLSKILALGLLAGPLAANAVPVAITFTSIDNGGMTMTATLDVLGGQALSGSGSITAASLDGGVSQGMTLVTSGYDGCLGDVAATFCVNFQPPPSNTGWVGDTVYGAASPWVSSYGLLFTIDDGNGSGFGLLWSGSNWQAYVASVPDVGNGIGILDPDDTDIGGTWDVYQASGFTSAVVPVPAAAWLFGSALGVLKVFRRRTTHRQSVRQLV
ncbi:MAG: VPLPA-CTERM sorting domain-containing protein [Gammaproteobacteria bacterium]|nr:VPLPA-CTERM sorting domain-containing protein [Gammaproteobacteria bacterium]